MRTKNAHVIVQDWLSEHAKSKHTRRKYDSQLQQLCEWMLLRELNFATINAPELEDYLEEVAMGMAHPDRPNAGQPRGYQTQMQSRSILRSFFQELVRQKFRSSNPIDLIDWPRDESKKDFTKASFVETEPTQWLGSRVGMLARAEADGRDRSPLWRAVAIAELSYWSSLRRSELATAVMGDFVHSEEGWSLKVKRFGHSEEDHVEVPQAAMKAVASYRISRGLPRWPTRSETQTPLISKLKVEGPVSSWTIANSLQLLAISGKAETVATKAPTIWKLRREMIHESLKAKIAPNHLARHVRSKGMVEQAAARLPYKSISSELEVLAG